MMRQWKRGVFGWVLGPVLLALSTYGCSTLDHTHANLAVDKTGVEKATGAANGCRCQGGRCRCQGGRCRCQGGRCGVQCGTASSGGCGQSEFRGVEGQCGSVQRRRRGTKGGGRSDQS